jgi:hypothetical protein
MVRPERRTRADMVAAGAIVVTVAVAAALIWWTSDARATISRPAAAPVADLVPAKVVPAALQQLWIAASPETSAPVIAGATVVTGNGHDVEGHNPVTGATVWSYARDLDLCGVSSIGHLAVAVYPDSRGCGQVSTIDGDTGRRGPTRTAYADKKVTLSTDGTTVLSAGSTRLELWRSDMVRVIVWGYTDAQVKPGIPAQPLCRLVSSAASSNAVSVLDACPGNRDLELTLLRPAKDDDNPDHRSVPQPGVTADSGARVLAVSDTTTAVYTPTPQPTISVIDQDGGTLASILLPEPLSPQARATEAGDLITLWTGDSVIVFDANRIRYRYTIRHTGPQIPVGPAAMMVGKLLIPVTGGVGVYDPATGKNERFIPLNRPPSQSAVILDVAGSTLIEQRGDTVVALGQK